MPGPGILVCETQDQIDRVLVRRLLTLGTMESVAEDSRKVALFRIGRSHPSCPIGARRRTPGVGAILPFANAKVLPDAAFDPSLG